MKKLTKTSIAIPVIFGTIVFFTMIFLSITPATEPTPKTIVAQEVFKTPAPPVAKYRGEYTVEKFVSNGTTNQFSLSDTYDDVTIRANGQILTDWHYDFTGKTFVLSSILRAGTVITFTGRGTK